MNPSADQNTKDRKIMNHYSGIDNGGRRSGFDRRSFLYAAYLPERRSGEERRCQSDRRIGMDESLVSESDADRRKNSIEIQMAKTI
jgi:hypothetical protein